MLIQSKFNYESIFIKKHNNVSNVMFSYHQVDWKRSFFYTFYHMIENDIGQVVLKRKKQSKDFNMNWLSTIIYPWKRCDLLFETQISLPEDTLFQISVVLDLENNINRWNSPMEYHFPSDKNKGILPRTPCAKVCLILVRWLKCEKSTPTTPKTTTATDNEHILIK